MNEDPQHPHGVPSTPNSMDVGLSTYRRLGGGSGGGGCVPRRETHEEIQAGRQREEARRCAEAIRIRREQVVRGFEEEIRALRARILALRRECEVRVARVRRRSERAHAIERGEVAVVVVEEEEEVMVSDSDSDADAEMEVEHKYAPTETSLTTDDDDDERSPCSEANIRFPPPSFLQTELRNIQQQQPPHVDMVGPSRLEPEAVEEEKEEDHRQPRPSQPLPQPLRRQPAQLMVIPTSSHSLHAYTTIPDPENRFCGDGDRDSEMGEQ